MIGKRIEKLVVVERLENSRLLCLCDCGKTKIIRTGHFNTGSMKSCGCHVVRHGMYGSKEYVSWGNMLARCHNKNNKRYKDYGEKGIIVCDRWRLSFKSFYEDMGDCPKGYQIDRIDNNGIYEPKNCKWVSPKDNMANRSISVKYSVNGVIYNTSKEAANSLNVSAHSIIAWCKGRWVKDKFYPPKKECFIIKKGLCE